MGLREILYFYWFIIQDVIEDTDEQSDEVVLSVRLWSVPSTGALSPWGRHAPSSWQMKMCTNPDVLHISYSGAFRKVTPHRHDQFLDPPPFPEDEGVGLDLLIFELLPGSSPGGSRVIRRWGRSWRLWKNTYLITDIERLEMDSAVGRLVEKKRLNNLDYVE